MLRASRYGSVAKPWSMLNIAIFNPWQRSVFSHQRTPGKASASTEGIVFIAYSTYFFSLTSFCVITGSLHSECIEILLVSGFKKIENSSATCCAN